MTNIVEYVLNLKGNQFDSGIATATTGVRGLESALSGVSGMIAGVAGAFAGISFLTGSVAMFNEAEAASAQLNATLKSTGNIANLNREALDAQSLAIMHKSTFDDDEITKAQSLLATFTNIRGEVFMNTVPAIVDLSTKMGGDLAGAAVQLGKALNDPEQGLTALRRVGVSFNEQQIKTIKHLQDTNQLAQAQTLILRELQTEFGGSAEAAASTAGGQLAIIQHDFNNVREEIGGLVMALVIELKPAIESIVASFSSAVTWVKEHKDGLEVLGKSIIAVVAVLTGLRALTIGYTLSVALLRPVLLQMTYAVAAGGTAFEVAAVGATSFGAALNAALGPIGWVAIAIGGITAALTIMNQKYEEAQVAQAALTLSQNDSYVEEQKRALDSEWKKSGMSKADFVKKEAKEVEAALASAAKSNDEALRTGGKQTSVQDLLLRKEAIDRLGYKAPVSAIMGGGAKPKKETADKAIGHKSVTINVSINDIVKTFNVNVTNMKEGAAKAREVILQGLMGAVNDAQITAGS